MAGRMGNMARGNCRFRYGGTASKTRNLGGGMKFPAYGGNKAVMENAKKGDEGTVSDAGIEVGGLPAKGNLSRPGRKWGGRTTKAKGKKDDDEDGYASGGFLHIKAPGSLRSALGAKEGENIPAKKLDKATHSDNPTLRRRAILAKTMRSWHHGKKD